MKYMDKDGNITIHVSGQDKLLRWMYTHALGRLLLKPLVMPWVSRLGGWFLGSPGSRFLIKPFVKRQNMDLEIYEKQDFESYNDFFTRQIKKQYRPIEGAAHTLISPCDGKLSVFTVDDVSRFSIKNTEYTLASLLRSEKLAGKFKGGYACVFRLTVDDYHRYCYVDSGRKSQNYRIPGVFHTVNPIANDMRPIYKENTREFSLLKSKHFKTILMMEVGALMVGRISNYDDACEVQKGQEKGRFEFGGSTVILLFQKNAVRIHQNLIDHTNEGYETIVRMGESIGNGVHQ